MSGVVKGRVAVITGAGQGLGRSHALEFARQGASVVVNDVGEAAEQVVSEIRAAGGVATASVGDVSDWDYAAALIDTAVSTYGRLDALVNNAGLVRDKMFVNLTEEEWDLCPSRRPERARFPPVPPRRGVLEGALEVGDGYRPRHQHDVGRGPARQRGPIELRRREGRHHRSDAGRGRGARPVRHHGQRNRPCRPHADDRGGVRRNHGSA